ncbi:MAG: Lsm family RNA-binding protein [Caldivirga sp.]|jgi:small nuclear ribonucleoprotein (snRNP)-like protein|uniref:Lsm family RNA-binding protein n=1 Tax=Caldivirga sp. MU80 TaxID=1650354 RepID=UPI00074A2CD8|nr:Lsm family RNA-binding protein [Caldivirga sp. MU80]KUO84155.1 MAG: small nuclear ribonucleoprotein (Sm) [Caldivirga sp. MG_3]KUO89613.1 MAG: small nuclear ribonucleoprotein (Sm) [Caldivirga sp. CIS_19]MDT7902940.1 Lsm family RNA-binding protein [Caldivirga sp.]
MAFGEGARRFNAEVMGMLGRMVLVNLMDGSSYRGQLVGIDQGLNMVLVNVVSSKNERYPKVLIRSEAIRDVALIEEYIDLRELAKILEKYFPGMVKYIDETNTIIVGENVTVTEEGVKGTGLMARRVKEIYDEYVQSRRR